MPIINPKGYRIVLPPTLVIQTISFDNLQGTSEPERKRSQEQQESDGPTPLHTLEEVLKGLEGEIRGDLSVLKRIWATELTELSKRLRRDTDLDSFVYEPPFLPPTASNIVEVEVCAKICSTLITGSVIHLGYLNEKKVYNILQTLFSTQTLVDGDVNDFITLINETMTETAIVGDETFVPELTVLDDEKYWYTDLKSLKAAKCLETQCCFIDCLTVPTIKAGLGKLLQMLYCSGNKEDGIGSRSNSVQRHHFQCFLSPGPSFNDRLLDELYGLRDAACDGLAQYLALHGIPIESVEGEEEKEGRKEIYGPQYQRIFHVVKEVIPRRFIPTCLSLRRSRRLPERTLVFFSCTPDTTDLSPIIEALSIVPQVKVIVFITGMVCPEWLTDELQARLQLHEIVTLDTGYRSAQLSRTLEMINKKSAELPDKDISQMKQGTHNSNDVVEQVSLILKHLGPQDRTRRILRTLIEMQLESVPSTGYQPLIPVQALLDDLSDIKKHKLLILQRGERLERILAGYISNQTSSHKSELKKSKQMIDPPIRLAPCQNGSPGIGLRGTREELEEILALLEEQPTRT
ncbi:hypothetical protein GMRT_10981 [Giardia muris]|uniref:Uncharacterized protein n=1 Tax=Giardia muris TaxID=5742 RepID=A0A4Z1STT2_GIAMU|nr:hypothetical protein GMRT_10981 [Giardia muris]|eukprot:TNJ29332.1 hypothetical protein GMRT_10981 [Giardia muris]